MKTMEWAHGTSETDCSTDTPRKNGRATMNHAGTQYRETNALLAILDEQPATAKHILSVMEGEDLLRLSVTATQFAQLVAQMAHDRLIDAD